MPKGVKKGRVQHEAHVGDVFGAWTVQQKDEARRLYYACLCQCGITKSVRIDSLISGQSTNCGCMARAKQSERAKERFTKHGLSESKVRSTWKDMIARCHNENCCNYKKYGAKGVIVCDRWRGEDGFMNFVQDMGIPGEMDTLERRSVQGNYTPENCVWESDKSVQNFNKRLSPNNTSGKTGVRKTRAGTWQASIMKYRVFYNLGTYKTFEEAVEARRAGELEHYGFYQEDI